MWRLKVRRWVLGQLPVRARLCLEERETSRILRELEEDYKPLLSSAKGVSDEETQKIQHRWWAERVLVQDEYEVHRSDYFQQFAIRYGVDLPPRPEQEERNADWEWSPVYGRHFLRPRALATIHRAVRQERRERWEYRFLWIGPVTGLLGALAAAISVWVAYLTVSR